MSDLKDLRSAKRLQPAFSIVLLACTGTLPGVALAFNISFDYTYDDNNFFNSQLKKDVLESAASFFESRILDDLTAITSSGPGGNDHFTAVFSDPATGATQTISDFSVAADTLTVFVGGRNLAGNTLGQGGPGGFGVGGSSTFITNSITRGETPTTDGTLNPRDADGNVTQETATDFAPWGGALTFDTDASANWYFDPDITTDADIVGNDFYSVALHELGHLLGIGTADSWDNQVVNNEFTGAASVAVNGGNVPTQAGGGHWAEGTQSVIAGTSTTQEAAMDPSIITGTRKVFTDLDLAGLQDVGWEIQADSAQ